VLIVLTHKLHVIFFARHFLLDNLSVFCYYGDFSLKKKELALVGSTSNTFKSHELTVIDRRHTAVLLIQCHLNLRQIAK
jgi:hypothetical protein